MTNEEIALTANYSLDADAFVNALIKVGFIDEKLNKDNTITRSLHDWHIHNAWAANAEKRSEAARKLARIRWDNKLNKQQVNAPRMRNAKRDGCEAQCNAHANGNAPFPLPYPSPSPSPKKQTQAWSQISKNDIKKAKDIFK